MGNKSVNWFHVRNAKLSQWHGVKLFLVRFANRLRASSVTMLPEMNAPMCQERFVPLFQKRSVNLFHVKNVRMFQEKFVKPNVKTSTGAKSAMNHNSNISLSLLTNFQIHCQYNQNLKIY